MSGHRQAYCYFYDLILAQTSEISSALVSCGKGLEFYYFGDSGRVCVTIVRKFPELPATPQNRRDGKRIQTVDRISRHSVF